MNLENRVYFFNDGLELLRRIDLEKYNKFIDKVEVQIKRIDKIPELLLSEFQTATSCGYQYIKKAQDCKYKLGAFYDDLIIGFECAHKFDGRLVGNGIYVSRFYRFYGVATKLLTNMLAIAKKEKLKGLSLEYMATTLLNLIKKLNTINSKKVNSPYNFHIYEDEDYGYCVDIKFNLDNNINNYY